jgi:hypothetical protein
MFIELTKIWLFITYLDLTLWRFLQEGGSVIHYICFACKGLVSWINYFYPKHEADCLKGAWNAIIFFFILFVP